MRRSEKIERFLGSHPKANERDLEKKFGLSWREANTLLLSRRGEAVEVEETGFWEDIFWNLKILFASERRTVVALVVTAVFVRLLYMLFLFQNDVLRIPLLDAEYYLKWAHEILQEGLIGSKIFFTEPFYAYLLACFLGLFGDTLGQTMLILFQFLLGSFFPALLYFVGKRMLSRDIGIIVGVIASLYGPYVFYEGLLLKTSLEIYFLPLFLWYLYEIFQKPSKKHFYIGGVFLGLLALIKGNVVVFLPVVFFLIWHLLKDEGRKTQAVLATLFFLGVITVISPIAFRNQYVGHDFVPTNYSIGLVLYQGNWWGGDGSTARVPSFLRPHPKYEEKDSVGMADDYLGYEAKPSEVSRFWMKKALSEVWSEPGHFFYTLWYRLLILVNHEEYSDNYSYAFYRSQAPLFWLLPNFFFIVLLGFAGGAVFLTRGFTEFLLETKREVKDIVRAKLLIVLPLLAYTGVLLLTTMNSRYRMPLTPFLILLGASFLVYAKAVLREHQPKKLVLPGIVTLIALAFVIWPLSLFRHLSFADAYHTIGYSYLEQGDYAQAERYFKKVIDEDPEYAWAFKNLALVAMHDHRYSEAEKYLKKLVVIRPDDLTTYTAIKDLKEIQKLSQVEANVRIQESLEKVIHEDKVYDSDYYEALRFLHMGDDSKAKEYIERSIKKQGETPEALMSLAGIATRANQDVEAKKYLEKAIDMNSELYVARYNLANIYVKEDNNEKLAETLKPVYEFVPELGETWYNYAVALVKTNKIDEAKPVMENFIKKYEDDKTKQDKVKKIKDVLEKIKQQKPSSDANSVMNSAKK